MIGIQNKEQQLVKNILNGNVRLFEELIHQYQKLVVSIVMRFTNDQYEREEVSQEIFIKIYKNLAGFQFKSKLSTWIGKISYNHCVNYIKKNSKYLYLDMDDQNDEISIMENSFIVLNSIENEIEDKELYSLINNNINQLPKLYQTIIYLFHMQEMSYSEISEVLDLPEGTVKSYLFRSRKLLKEKLLSSYKEEELL